jgi:hypothetical protein
MAGRDSSLASRLFYHQTQTEVRLGDRVRIRRWLRRAREGTVCYLPGISPLHEELEYDDVKQWAIRTDDGAVYPILYDPERFQPPKHISFLARSDDAGLQPADHLE